MLTKEQRRGEPERKKRMKTEIKGPGDGERLQCKRSGAHPKALKKDQYAKNLTNNQGTKTIKKRRKCLTGSQQPKSDQKEKSWGESPVEKDQKKGPSYASDLGRRKKEEKKKKLKLKTPYRDQKKGKGERKTS